jgi:DNA-3-methyladenine glycosylase I
VTLVVGDDGRARCSWAANDPEYRRYHDEEWGVPLHGDQPLFEKLSLEGFQAGLSWITILRRRPTFREAFHGFEIEKVAAMTEADVDALMLNAGIIRNRAKIEATISNAKRALELTGDNPGALDELIWSFAPPAGRARPVGTARPVNTARPVDLDAVPAITDASTAMSKALRALGFRFVGPTTMYALMQSAGMVDDHLVGCWRAVS